MVPYRSPAGAECPRCQIALRPSDEGLRCEHGCGEWIARTAILRLVGTAEIETLGTPAPYFKVTRLPPTRCPCCDSLLDDLYRSLDDADHIALGCCRTHGIWVEGRGRDDFERCYRVAIATYRAAEAQVTALAEILRLDGLNVAAYRILRLEARIAALESQLAKRHP